MADEITKPRFANRKAGESDEAFNKRHADYQTRKAAYDAQSGGKKGDNNPSSGKPDKVAERDQQGAVDPVAKPSDPTDTQLADAADRVAERKEEVQERVEEIQEESYAPDAAENTREIHAPPLDAPEKTEAEWAVTGEGIRERQKQFDKQQWENQNLQRGAQFVSSQLDAERGALLEEADDRAHGQGWPLSSEVARPGEPGTGFKERAPSIDDPDPLDRPIRAEDNPEEPTAEDLDLSPAEADRLYGPKVEHTDGEGDEAKTYTLRGDKAKSVVEWAKVGHPDPIAAAEHSYQQLHGIKPLGWPQNAELALRAAGFGSLVKKRDED